VCVCVCYLQVVLPVELCGLFLRQTAGAVLHWGEDSGGNVDVVTLHQHRNIFVREIKAPVGRLPIKEKSEECTSTILYSLQTDFFFCVCLFMQIAMAMARVGQRRRTLSVAPL